MARKRMIDPSIWTDEGMALLSDRQRLLYIGLFSNADDHGKLSGSALAIQMMLPVVYIGCSRDEVEQDLAALTAVMRQVVRYEVDGRLYICIRNWHEWQKVPKPQDSSIPDPPEDERELITEPVANQFGNGSVMVSKRFSDQSEPVTPKERKKERKENTLTGGGDTAAPANGNGERQAMFAALMQEFYSQLSDHTELTKPARGELNAAVRDLLEIRAGPDEVPVRGSVYRERWPDIEYTPSALVKHWPKLDPARQPSKAKDRVDREYEAFKASQASDSPF